MSLRPKRSSRPRLGLSLTILVMLFAAACSDSSTPETTEAADGSGGFGGFSEPLVIENLGDSALEGHTPQGFAGSGTGLFAGDNLNANFPEGEGVQIFISFALPDTASEINSELVSATLSSDAMTVRGTPFATLGQLRAQAVTFEAFGPPVFETPGLGSPAECIRRGESAIDCDVTEAAADALADGRSELQLRLRFDTRGDGDGEQDLALFFLTDSNTNEPGIFTLTLE